MTAFIEMTTTSDDRWDLLAYRYYGDANRTAPLIEANRAMYEAELAALPAIIPVGTKLRIPVLPEETVNEDLLPPWKRGLTQ